MEKPTKRKAFNFLRSYFDVLNELEKKSDKLDFLMSIINKQFLDEDPKELNFIVNLSYQSQKHAIETSVKGYEQKTGNKLKNDELTELKGGTQGGTQGASVQEKEEEKEKEEYTIDYLYKLYPTNCPFKNKSLGKCDKDKKKIEQLLKVYTSKEIEDRIQFYIKDCNTSRTWYKNFGTLLNNLPDITEIPVVVRNKPRKPTF